MHAECTGSQDTGGLDCCFFFELSHQAFCILHPSEEPLAEMHKDWERRFAKRFGGKPLRDMPPD
jgi:hypothetical protein